MKKLIYAIILLIFIGCNQSPSLKGTKWKFSCDEGTSTLIFSDSTYICRAEYDNTKDSAHGTYTYIHPNVFIKSKHNELELYVDDNKLITKEEFPIAFIKQKP